MFALSFYSWFSKIFTDNALCFSPGPVNPDIVCFQQFPGMPGGPEGGMGMGPDMGQVMNGGE